MNTEQLCLKCMQNGVINGVCSFCHTPAPYLQEPSFALPAGTILHGRYLVGAVLGYGGFGVTYLALDLNDGHRAAIKEYMPNGLATRTPGETWMRISTGEEDYRYGLDQFLEEARIIYQLSDSENIVKVEKLFEENHTAYYAMEFLSGADLKHTVKAAGGKLTYARAQSLLLPVFTALERVHARGVVHRDISPDNIFICSDGRVKLLDFGAARMALSEKSESIDVILKRGYAPEEQYRSHGRQGPWTDVYALGCTLYYCITGHVPPEAVERIHEDKCLPAVSFCSDIPPCAQQALKKAMAVLAQNRFQSVGEFRAALMGKPAAAETPRSTPRIPPAPAPPRHATVISNSPVSPAGVSEDSVPWRRLGAYVIDNVIASILSGILFWIFAPMTLGALFCIVFLILFTYALSMESSAKRATLGKQWLRLQVTGLSGEVAPPGQVCIRNAVKYVPYLLCLWLPMWVSGLWMLLDGGAVLVTKNRQALHDIAAKTNVMPPVDYRAVVVPVEKPQAIDPEAVGIRCVSGLFKGMFFPLSGTKIILGRSVQSCSVVFPQDAMGVSSRHCELVWDKSTSTVVIKDLGSTYGTFVSDGRRLSPNQMAVLRGGDSFTIGNQNTFVIKIG